MIIYHKKSVGPKKKKKAECENKKMLREVDKLDQYEKIFTENAVELVHSEGIEVKDPQFVGQRPWSWWKKMLTNCTTLHPEVV